MPQFETNSACIHNSSQPIDTSPSASRSRQYWPKGGRRRIRKRALWLVKCQPHAEVARVMRRWLECAAADLACSSTNLTRVALQPDCFSLLLFLSTVVRTARLSISNAQRSRVWTARAIFASTTGNVNHLCSSALVLDCETCANRSVLPAFPYRRVMPLRTNILFSPL